jgi:hypothetical protein
MVAITTPYVAPHGYLDDEIAAAVAEGREIWRTVPGYEGKYEASSLGQVRSLSRMLPCLHTTALRKGRVLKPYPNPRWKYLTVALGGETGPMTVHRIVASTFLTPAEGREHVNHKDGDRQNNRLENLEWISRSENMRHASRVLGRNNGELHGMAKLTPDDVDDIRIVHAFGASMGSIARAYGLVPCTVHSIVHGRSWKRHLGTQAKEYHTA